VKRLQHGGKRTSSLAAIPLKLQGLCFTAQTWITNYTFFRLPFLSSLDVINLIQEAWEWAQDQEKAYPPSTKACEPLVSHSQPSKVQLLTWSSLKASIPGTGRTPFTSAARSLCSCTSWITRRRMRLQRRSSGCSRRIDLFAGRSSRR